MRTDKIYDYKHLRSHKNEPKYLDLLYLVFFIVYAVLALFTIITSENINQPVLANYQHIEKGGEIK